MTRETRILLARQQLGYSSLGEFVDWAVFLLEAGTDTKHLRMLASLSHAPNRADVTFCFGQVMDELGWRAPEPLLLLYQYAQDLAKDIVDGKIAPIEGCHQMYRLYSDLDAPREMQVWLYLDDQLEEETYEELEGAVWESAIRREAQKFLQVKP